jgi:hypothetical protein
MHPIGQPGTYGFAISGADGIAPLLGSAEPGWPRLNLTAARAEPGGAQAPDGPGTVRIGHERATVWVSDSERIELDRRAGSVRIVTHEPIAPEFVAHPYLALPAAIAARWLGRQTFHGGAFVHDGKAWAVFGDKEAGKSSVLGWLLGAGREIVSDDMLILDDGILFAGPRCVDLRAETAAVIGGEDIGGPLQSRRRWRLRAGPAPPPLPLGGVIHLAWADDVAVEPLGAEQRLEELVRGSVMYPDGSESVAYLGLAGLPTFRFARPREIDGLEQANAQLLAALP